MIPRDVFFSLSPLATMKSLRPPEPSWIDASPETLAYVAFAALALIVLYVFSR